MQKIKSESTESSQSASNELLSFVSVPLIPEAECIESMCLRYDHSFGFKKMLVETADPWRYETDEEFERRRDSIRNTMRQLYEEATGQGFFKR